MSNKRSIKLLIADFMNYLKSKNYSELTVYSYTNQLKFFTNFLTSRKISLISQIDKTVILNYQQYIFYYKYKDHKGILNPLKCSVQKLRLVAIIAFFKYLDKNDIIVKNPSKYIELPKREKRIPRDILTPDEIDKLFQLPDMSTLLGYRDRTILELLYSSGIRRFEVCKLNIFDIDFNEKVLFVKGKGQKDRIVPIGSVALKYLKQYIDIIRHKLINPNNSSNWLFLNRLGDRFTKAGLNQLVSRYVKRLCLENKKINCHSFRASMATAMLKNGANLLHIQQILGHARPETTQVYTKIDISDLKKAHNQTHPRR